MDKPIVKNTMNLQDSFLNHVRKENLAVVLYLVNGFQIRGLVRGFDNFTVIIECEGKQQLVYKHAISTISPLQPLKNSFQDNKRTETVSE